MIADDRELDGWRAEWRDVTPSPPDLSLWMRAARRNLLYRTLLAGLVFVGIGIAAVLMFLDSPSPRHRLLACGIAVVGVFALGFLIRARRNTWRPVADTTRAFLGL